MASTSPPPRRVPPEQALPEPRPGVSQAAGAAAASVAVGAAGGGAAGIAATAPAVPLLKLTQASLEKMRDAVRAFWRLQRAREEAWIIGTLGSRIPEQAVLDLFADESARALEFQRGQDRRLERDFGVLLSRAQAGNITPAKVKERLGQITAREQLYATRRSEAMAARALALADRIILRGDSPQGAFWKLGQADKHTPDCVAMAGRFWPWEALAIIHPPSHTGCKCSLWSYKTAVAKGWMKAGDVMDVRTAMIKAAAAKLLLHEEEAEGMVEALLREGLVGSVEEFARASALALPTGRST